MSTTFWRDHCRVRAFAGVLISGAMFLASPAMAAEWTTTPRLEVGAVYDDNVLLIDDDADAVSVSGADLQAQVALRGATPRTELLVVPRVRSSFYDESDQNSTDYYLEMQAIRRGQRLQADLRLDFANETTSRSERPGLEDPDLGEPIGGDSGIIVNQSERQSISAQPKLLFNLTQRNAIEVGTRYRDVEYDRASSLQTGFTSFGGSLGWVHRLSQIGTLTLRADAGKYEPDSAERQDADSVGAEAEWRRQFSDIGETYLRGGFRRTSQDSLPTDLIQRDDVTSYVGGAGVKWAFAVSRLSLDLTMSVDPNASGVLVKRDQIRVQLHRQFRPKLSGDFGLRYIRDESVDDTLGNDKRDYGVAVAGLEWRHTRAVSFTAEYNYTNQKLERNVLDIDAVSNSMHVSIVYQPRREDDE